MKGIFNKNKIVTLVFLGVALVVFFFLVTLNTKDPVNEIINFPMLENGDDVDGVIVYKEKIVRGYQTRVVLQTGQKYIIEKSVNHSIGKNSMLCDFLQEKDSVIKKSGSDSIFIYRKDKEFLFVLGDYIDSPAKSIVKIN